MEVVQIVILLFAIFALSRAFLRLRERQMAASAFAFWTLLWAALILLTLLPSALSSIARKLGVSSGTNLLVIFGIMLLFYLIFRLYIRLDKTEKEMTRLITELALKEKKK